jgi:SAM-dependent methyltransferase
MLPAADIDEPPCGATDAGRLPEGVGLRCPRCRTAMQGGHCPGCGLAIDVRSGIVRALAPEARTRLARFMDEYARIRAAEGRRGERAGDYLGLPYRAPAGQDRSHWRLRRRGYEYLVRRLLPGPGPVLDLGAGNGWLSYRLALDGYRPCAVDLLVDDDDGLGAARHFRSRLPALFPRFQASFEALPFLDAQFDAAVFNASFHYAADGAVVLAEALRCVKPGGLVVVIDTPWYPRDMDGVAMLAERRATFLRRHGIAGDALPMWGYLSDARLEATARALSLRWEVHRPWYGLAWSARPLLAALRGRRRPSRFRIHVVRKPAG